MPMMETFSYTCDGGQKLVVYLREHNARVTYKGKSYSMQQTASASGTRYSDGTTVWWSKENEGFLEEDSNLNAPPMIAKNCKLDEGSTANANSLVSGTVAYRDRMAMPANALLTVQLQDVSLADVPAAVIAEQKIEFAGKQVPLPFELHYDRAKIDRSHTYSVSARITVDGQLKFLNTSAHRVITRGNPAQVNVMLQRVATPTDDLKH
jgi:putative lipoprotein